MNSETNREMNAEKKMNRDLIKYIAMFTMLLNHIAHVFLTRGTLLYEVLEDIGYFTAPVMCYFLVEGYLHTRSKAKYGGRLFLFAVLSQIPYYLAFHYQNLNMFFTLFCCFMILVVMERVDSYFLQNILCVLLILVTAVSDWGVIAPLLTLLLARNWEEKGRMRAVYLGIALFFAVLNIPGYLGGQSGGQALLLALCHALCSSLGVLAAGAVVLGFYNGQRAKKGQTFCKWFFYLFYPGHLFLLYFIKIGLHNM
ncbi:MAG: conjugal transfer protein TraX [Bacteroidales bacterium]|nr:conjugal transfer protein TraX [Bacteroidales bacterium]MCM1416516.1 conjugal transfer protein TraX [bacterium]MCM1424494.1 conjugal transfer protein TraX [bacterium]